eukprot:4446697-Amphidinium_carterae.4
MRSAGSGGASTSPSLTTLVATSPSTSTICSSICSANADARLRGKGLSTGDATASAITGLTCNGRTTGGVSNAASASTGRLGLSR